MLPVDAENILIKVNNWRVLSFRHLNGEVVLHLFAIKILIAGPAQFEANSKLVSYRPKSRNNHRCFVIFLHAVCLFLFSLFVLQKGVSKNRGTPKWMVFIWKTRWKWMIWGYHYFRKHPKKCCLHVCFFLNQYVWNRRIPSFCHLHKCRGRRVGALLLDHIQRLQVRWGRFMQQLMENIMKYEENCLYGIYMGMLCFKKKITLKSPVFF